MKVKVLAISGILEIADKRVQVVLSGSGKEVWIPKKEVDFCPGAVIVSRWYWEAVLSKDPAIAFADG